MERRNLAYVTHGGPSQTLDLYARGGCGLYADPEVAPMVKAFFAAH